MGLGLVLLVAAVIFRGGGSASTVGPVVFHADVVFTGEHHGQERFTDRTTAKAVSSCAQAAAHGDSPSKGPNVWQVPTPPLDNAVEIDIGTSPRGYRGPGRYVQGALATGDGAMDVGQESYDLTDPDATASVTVDADGSGHVTFAHVPNDEDDPHRGWHGGISGAIEWTCTD